MPLLFLFCLYLNFYLFNCEEQPKFEDTSDLPMQPSYKYDSDTERRFEELKEKIQKDYARRKANIPPNFGMGLLDYDISHLDFFGTTKAKTDQNDQNKKDRPIWAPKRRPMTQKVPQFDDGDLMHMSTPISPVIERMGDHITTTSVLLDKDRPLWAPNRNVNNQKGFEGFRRHFDDGDLMHMSIPISPEKHIDDHITTAEPVLNNNRPLWAPNRNVNRQKGFEGFRRQFDDDDLMHMSAPTSPETKTKEERSTTTSVVLDNDHLIWAPNRRFRTPAPDFGDDHLMHLTVPASFEMVAMEDFNVTTTGTVLDNDLTVPKNSKEKSPKHTFKQLIEMKRRRRIANRFRREFDNENAVIPQKYDQRFKKTMHPYYDSKNVVTNIKNQENNAIIPEKFDQRFKKTMHPYYDRKNIITQIKNQDNNATIPEKFDQRFRKAFHPYYDSKNIIIKTENLNENNVISVQSGNSSRDLFTPFRFGNLESRVLDAI